MKNTIKHYPQFSRQRINASAQQGWTMWSMLFVMSVAFVAAYLAMQLIPIYSANESIKMAMRATVEGKNLRSVTNRQLIAELQRKLYIDGNHDLMEDKEFLKITKVSNKFIMQANYEREIPLVSNLFVVARFDTKIECQMNGSCDP